LPGQAFLMRAPLRSSRASTSPKAAMSIDADDYLTKSVGRVACPMQRRGGPEAA
jgi:hypothetical protein